MTAIRRGCYAMLSDRGRDCQTTMDCTGHGTIDYSRGIAPAGHNHTLSE